MSRNWRDLLAAQWNQDRFVCVGLDSDLSKIPKIVHVTSIGQIKPGETIFRFNKAIVDATKDIAGCYKINVAFYEEFGAEGMTALFMTVRYINEVAPDIPVILDAKRADIGNTNEGYVEMAFDWLGADAITVHPYLGAEALAPFLERKDKGVIVLCKTSNPGAGEFQDLDVSGDEVSGGYMPLYLHLAHRVDREWNKNGNCGLVVGATYPGQLEDVRDITSMPILIPGIGFQQKDVPMEQQVQQAVEAGRDSRGQGMIINSSRAIIFASNGPDFAEAARRETLKLHELINQYR